MPTRLPPAVQAHLRAQDGVVSRRQLREAAVPETLVRTWLRHRTLVRLLPGVYVDHTGPTTWRQRAWAAVLYAAPAVLHAESALRAASGPGRRGHDDEGPVHVLVDAARTVREQPGVRIHRARHLDTAAQWNTSPPRVRLEDAALDVAAAAADDHAAFSVLAVAVSSRQTTAVRLRSALTARSRIGRRAFLVAALDDLA